MSTLLLTDRRRLLLQLLRRWKFLTRQQITRSCYPTDRDGSVTREDLRKLKSAQYVRALRAEVGVPAHQTTVPVYVPTEQGCLALATATSEMSWLLDAPVPTGNWTNYAHYVAVSELGMQFEAALASQQYVQSTAWLLEHDLVQPQAKTPQERYKLYTEVCRTPRRVVCIPDACVGLQVQGVTRAAYLELERGGDTPARVAASKTPGYAGLIQQRLFTRHIPTAQDARVLAICPNVAWRDALVEQLVNRPGAEFWMVAAWPDITPARLLHEPIFRKVGSSSLQALVKSPTPLSAPSLPPPPAPSLGSMGELLAEVVS
jgi:Replication-relaxation